MKKLDIKLYKRLRKTQPTDYAYFSFSCVQCLLISIYILCYVCYKVCPETWKCAKVPGLCYVIEESNKKMFLRQLTFLGSSRIYDIDMILGNVWQKFWPSFSLALLVWLSRLPYLAAISADGCCINSNKCILSIESSFKQCR